MNSRLPQHQLSQSQIVEEDTLNVSTLNKLPASLPFLPTSRNPCFLTTSQNHTKLRYGIGTQSLLVLKRNVTLVTVIDQHVLFIS